MSAKATNNEISIREIHPTEYNFLETMLYEAIFVPEGAEPPPPAIIYVPELKAYYSDFGKAGDFCLIAEMDNNLLGAIWIRQFKESNKGYGYIDSQTPELSMAVAKKHQGKGIGTALLKEFMDKCIKKGIEKISLSVDKLNFAYQLYKKFGFEDFSEKDGSITMVNTPTLTSQNKTKQYIKNTSKSTTA